MPVQSSKTRYFTDGVKLVQVDHCSLLARKFSTTACRSIEPGRPAAQTIKSAECGTGECECHEQQIVPITLGYLCNSSTDNQSYSRYWG
ncbi:MAG TPA: hypothetical protein VGJ55_20380 [Pyrinomonadaceae bacterium]